MFKKMFEDALIKILRMLGRYKSEYPEGLKYERKESFKTQIRKINDSKNDNKK